MLKISVNKQQVEYTESLLKNKNVGKRGDGSRKYNNGNKDEQFTGILGEVVICDYFNQPRPRLDNADGDHGVDMIINSLKIDIKTMTRSCDMKDFFVHNLQGEQVGEYYKNDIYLFTSYNKVKEEITICGWVTKEEFFKLANHYPYGEVRKNNSKKFKVRNKKGLYEIKNSVLNAFWGKKGFMKDMLNLKSTCMKNMQEAI